MGLFDRFKKKKDGENVENVEGVEGVEAAENSVNGEGAEEQAASESSVTEEAPRASLLERLSGGEPIFTDHESDIQFQEEYEAQLKEESFYKLKEGLKKTKDGFVGKLEQLLNSFTKIDEDFFDELEETLILSDIGAETSADICDKLRAEVKRTDYYWNKSVLKYAVVNKNTIVVKGRGRIPDVEPDEMFSCEEKNKWHIVEEVEDIKEDIKNLVIIGDITHIGTRCFKEFEKLENVVIPNCVETIGSSAFSGCTSLKSVILPEKLKTIETEAFQFSGLQHIKIPKTTKKIAERAFSGCKNLESVLVPKSTAVESNAFRGCDKLD